MKVVQLTDSTDISNYGDPPWIKAGPLFGLFQHTYLIRRQPPIDISDFAHSRYEFLATLLTLQKET